MPILLTRRGPLSSILRALGPTFAVAALVAACSSSGGAPNSSLAEPTPAAQPVADASVAEPEPAPPTCVPRCAGKECGSDGCGGSCGRCASGETCDARTGQCAKDRCVPVCGQRTCGFDGCGGSCGSCPVGVCNASGHCECRADTDCGPSARCGFDASGKRVCVATCDTFAPLATCTPGEACDDVAVETFTGGVDAVCGAYGAKLEGDPCVRATGGAFGHDCAPGLLCAQTTSAGALACVRFCDTQHACPKAGQQCAAISVNGKTTSYQTCTPPMGACQPNPCRELHRSACEVSGASYTCGCDAGYVEVNGRCQIPCTPQCNGKQCGDDGCGGVCGTCVLPAACTSASTCCAPQCSGKQCGPDGCGGTCGSCATGSLCSGSGSCEVCVPQCAGRQCGSDGCGGSCGTCGSGRSCSLGGQCTCTPRCGGKQCGDDGCGGSCGTCRPGSSCTQGTCLECDPVSNTGCGAGEGCWALSSGSAACSVTGSGRQGDACSSTSNCAGGYACFSRVCRKVCDVATGAGCPFGSTCNGVTGWSRYGACQ